MPPISDWGLFTNDFGKFERMLFKRFERREKGKEATSILFNGYFIAGAVSSAIGTIGLILWIKNKYFDY